ncbi:MAG: hypothetical protein CL610_04360 [Anaerolineaceae bacterium]|nr:hypothetical protein [Anaerolineaceae bacterium]
MDYQIHKLKDDLVYICWYQTPKPNSGTDTQYLADMEALLNEAETPIYFVSDLRKGRITDIRAIRMLAKLTRHRNWAGSTAFSEDPITGILVGSFRAFAADKRTSNDEIKRVPEEALQFLNELKPGIVDGIDWDSIIREDQVD